MNVLELFFSCSFVSFSLFLFYFSASRKIKWHCMYFNLEACYRATRFSWCTEGAGPSSRCWKISQEKWKRWPASRNIGESMMGWALLVGGALKHSHSQRETRSNKKSNEIVQRLNTAATPKLKFYFMALCVRFKNVCLKWNRKHTYICIKLGKVTQRWTLFLFKKHYICIRSYCSCAKVYLRRCLYCIVLSDH